MPRWTCSASIEVRPPNLLYPPWTTYCLGFGRFQGRNRDSGATEVVRRSSMRRRGWARAMLGPVMVAGALTVATPAAQAQMCTPAVKDCESQADADSQRCTFHCQRYVNICTDP